MDLKLGLFCQRILLMCLVAANDEESSVISNEPDVEYTEVVHPRAVDPARGRHFIH